MQDSGGRRIESGHLPYEAAADAPVLIDPGQVDQWTAGRCDRHLRRVADGCGAGLGLGVPDSDFVGHCTRSGIIAA
jgi:hypothetical protein